MDGLANAHLAAISESIRFLRSVDFWSPDLRSELFGLQDSLPAPTAPETAGERDVGSSQSLEAALSVAKAAVASVDALAARLGAGIDAELAARTSDVLARAADHAAAKVRASAADRVRGLYVIVDPEVTRGRPILDVAEASLKGGASVVQLRDKSRDKGEMLPDAIRLQAMCEDYGSLFVVNDDADLARTVSSHAVHVGQTDLPVASARAVLDARQLVGTSNGGVDEALRSQAEGADYVAVGAIFATTTMGKSGRRSLGVEAIAEVKDAVSMPVVAIGGISLGNITDVVSAGADSVCVVSAVTFADDPETAAARLVEAMQAASA